MGMSAQARAATKQGLELAIPHEMSTAEWAETYRHVGRGARKGKWSNETVPFLVDLMNAADDPLVREIVFQKPAQIGGSEFLSNIIGKRMHQSPTEIAYVAEKEDKATAWTQESFDTMVAATPVLRRLVSDKPEFNNQKYKWFSGGGLFIVWATSPAELSSRPFEILLFDEKAAYKPTKEGDAVALGEERQNTYDETRLTVKNSTPRRCDCQPSDTCGDISHDYEAGDQREFYVPCPHCDVFQTLKFGGKDTAFGLKWDPETPESPYYLCEHCAAVIEEFDKDDMLAKGYWRAAKEFNGIASFKINQLYSPFVSWGTIVGKWLKACTDKEKLEVFTNTTLSEPWRPTATIAYEDLTWNLEVYPAQVPPGVLVLTAGVDVQKNRLECEVVGWGHGDESWSIDYKVFEGDTGVESAVSGQHSAVSDETEQEELSSVWDQLEDFLTSVFEGPGGQAFRVQCVCVDSGYETQKVYKFVKKHERKRWYAVKGMSDPFKPMISKPTLQGRNPKVRLFPLGVNAIKDEVFNALRNTKPGPEFCHFPATDQYDEDHMRQLCSEKMTTHTRGGRTYRVYEKRGPNVRNEALDIRCYAVAAREILNPNYEAIERRRLQHAEVADREADGDQQDAVSDEKPEPPKPTTPESRRSTFKVIGRKDFEGYKP